LLDRADFFRERRGRGNQWGAEVESQILGCKIHRTMLYECDQPGQNTLELVDRKGAPEPTVILTLKNRGRLGLGSAPSRAAFSRRWKLGDKQAVPPLLAKLDDNDGFLDLFVTDDGRTRPRLRLSG